MKTLKITLLLVCVIFCTTKITAQTFYYNTTRTFQLDNGVTFRAYVDEYGEVTLYNTNNRFVHQQPTLRDGSPIPADFWRRGAGPVMISNTGPLPGVYEEEVIVYIVSSFLCGDQQARVGSEILGIDVFVDPHQSPAFGHDCWQPVGISFDFDYDSPWATIPVETFQQIEEQLMLRLFYIVTERGMQLNFIRSGFSVDIARGRA